MSLNIRSTGTFTETSGLPGRLLRLQDNEWFAGRHKVQRNTGGRPHERCLGWYPSGSSYSLRFL